MTWHGGAQDFFPGNLDPSFHIGSGPNGYISSAALQPDGRILVAGTFTQYHGVERRYVARLNSDGTLDSSFQFPNLELSPGEHAKDVLVMPDGRIMVAGSSEFVRYNGSAEQGFPKTLLRLNQNGAVDDTFAPPRNLNLEVQNLALDNEGKLLVFGYLFAFPPVVPIPRNWLGIRLSSEGNPDPDFNVEDGLDRSAVVYAVKPRQDGKIYVAGVFTNFNGVPRNRLLRLNADGTLDTNFVGQMQNTTYHESRAVLPLPDGTVLAASDFGYIVRFNEDGTGYHRFSPYVGDVYQLALRGDGTIMVGSLDGLMRLNADGTVDSTFATGPFPPGKAPIGNALLFQDKNTLIVSGYDYVNDLHGELLRFFLNTVTLPKFLSSSSRISSDGSFQCTVLPGSAEALLFQSSTNLKDWVAVSTNRVTNSVMVLTDRNAPNHSQRMYRAIMVDAVE